MLLTAPNFSNLTYSSRVVFTTSSFHATSTNLSEYHFDRILTIRLRLRLRLSLRLRLRTLVNMGTGFSYLNIIIDNKDEISSLSLHLHKFL